MNTQANNASDTIVYWVVPMLLVLGILIALFASPQIRLWWRRRSARMKPSSPKHPPAGGGGHHDHGWGWKGWTIFLIVIFAILLPIVVITFSEALAGIHFARVDEIHQRNPVRYRWHLFEETLPGRRHMVTDQAVFTAYGTGRISFKFKSYGHNDWVWTWAMGQEKGTINLVKDDGILYEAWFKLDPIPSEGDVTQITGTFLDYEELDMTVTPKVKRLYLVRGPYQGREESFWSFVWN